MASWASKVLILKDTPTQVKASGGIHTPEEAAALVKAGATRLGVSHSLDIIAKDSVLS